MLMILLLSRVSYFFLFKCEKTLSESTEADSRLSFQGQITREIKEIWQTAAHNNIHDHIVQYDLGLMA